MIDLHGQAGLPYINRGVYTGSYEGMRYRMRKKEEEDKKVLEAVIYPEPFCFEKTAEEQKEAHEFPFTDEGFQQAIAWMNEQYETQKERWTAAKNASWV